MAIQSITPQAPLAALTAAQAAAASATTAAAADSKAMGKAGFDDLAGMGAVPTHAARVRTPLARRLSRTPAPQQAASHDDHDTPLKATAAQLIESLSRPEDDGLDRWQGTHDPLQQQLLLEQARELLERQPDDGGGRRERLGARLDALQAELTRQHGAAIAGGRRDADAFEGALATLAALDAGAAGDGPGALSALRRAFGAPAAGRRDAPLAPAALLEILLRQAGPAGAGAALGRPPAQMHEALRRRGRAGPRLWLSLQDAACFQLVNTSYALAGELRQALSEQAATAPLAGQGALAGMLLRLGEPEAGQAEPMLRQLADMARLTPRQRAGACRALRGVLARCPDGMWGGEAPAQRPRLLEQLRQMTIEHHAALPTLSRADDDALQSRLRRDHQRAGSP